VLQHLLSGLTDEQRQASEIIFGSDAVRAANVLYEQGAKGISGLDQQGQRGWLRRRHGQHQAGQP
jgi:hypothetical protein